MGEIASITQLRMSYLRWAMVIESDSINRHYLDLFNKDWKASEALARK